MAARSSILLPVYNGARFLDEQLETILAQSDSDFEIIAIDDGSTDGSQDILARHAVRHAAVTVLRSSGNAGQNARLRELLAHATGQFVMIADQDDLWHPLRNERLLAAIGSKPLAFGRSDLIDAGGTPIGSTLLESLTLTPDPDARLRTLFVPLASAHASVVRRDWIDPAIFGHPMPFDWLMSALALFDGGAAYVPDAIVGHRIHDRNQMNRSAPDRGRWMGDLRNRIAVVATKPQRLRFWLMLNFLGRWAKLPEHRRLFGDFAGRCRLAWFGRPRITITDGELRRHLETGLRPLAGSDTDWTMAKLHIDRLTRSIAHPATMKDALSAIFER